MSPKTLLAASLILYRLPPAALHADDWPQWRGLNRDGACRETGLLETFPAGGLEVRWRAPVGWGFSSPVVAGGRVFLADAEVVQPKPKERVHCFEETTGKALWTHSYEAAYPDWAFDPAQESGPVATPVVRDGKVYTVGRLGHVFCLNAVKGDVLWQKNLETDYKVAWSPGMPSPLIEGDLLILFTGVKPDACVVAFHKDTGKEVWRALDESLTFQLAGCHRFRREATTHRLDAGIGDFIGPDDRHDLLAGAAPDRQRLRGVHTGLLQGPAADRRHDVSDGP